MAYGESNSNNVAIVALIVVGVLIAGAAMLYFSGAIGGRDVVHRDTMTIIERPAVVDEGSEREKEPE